MARRYEKPFFSVVVFTAYDTGLKVNEKEPLIIPPGKKGAISDIPELIRDAQRVGASVKHLGLKTLQNLKKYAKENRLVLTSIDGIFDPNSKVEEPKDDPPKE